MAAAATDITTKFKAGKKGGGGASPEAVSFFYQQRKKVPRDGYVSRFPLLPLLASLVTWLTIAGGEAEKVSTQQRLLGWLGLVQISCCLIWARCCSEQRQGWESEGRGGDCWGLQTK